MRGFLFFIALNCWAVPIMAQQPNILWITIEDTSPHFIGCYGNQHASTPVIDKLAAEGVRFTNAFSTGTVCSPSRTTIITGVRTYALGAGHHRSAYPIPESIKGFPWYLRQQGYHVSNNSKTDYNVANEKAFIRETWDESSPKAGWWNRKPGQPFFSVINFMESHQSRTMTHPYEWYEEHVLRQLPEGGRIGADEIPMPPFYRDTPEMRRQVARVYNSIKLTDNRIGALLERLKKDNLMDSTIIFFYADHGEGIPRGKTNGINLGYRVPFIIWFPPMYRHLSPWKNGVTDELVSFEDLAPTLISLAGGEIPDHLNGRVLFGERRSAPPKHLILSSDRSDNGMDMVRSVTDGRYMYSRNYMPFMPEARYIRYMEIGEIKQLMRDDLAKGKLDSLQESIFGDRPAEFLFDVEGDVWETRNLVGDITKELLLKNFRAVLKDNIMATRDVMFLPEYEIASVAEIVAPYTFRQDTSAYPLQDIYDAAALSGQRGEVVARRQISLLNDANKIVRYWAITGLRAQDEEVIKRYRKQLNKAMSDSYAPVVITASVISYDMFGNKKAEALLKKYITDQNMHLALMAINNLLYVRDPEPFIEKVKDVYNNADVTYNVSAASKDFLGRLGIIPNNFEYK